jgi:replicative DNA helicase
MTEQRLPPHDIRAEEMVIACLMVDGDLIQEIKSLEPRDFYHEVLGIIYKICLDLYHRSEAINQTTVAQEEERLGKSEYCGGASYLLLLTSKVETIYDIQSYANIVHNLSISRQLIVLGEQCSQIGYSANPDSKQSIQTVYDKISDFKKNNMRFEGIITPKEASNIMYGFIEEYKKPSHSIKWGMDEIDEITSGIYPAELIVIGARPSVGKTQLMLDIAENIAEKGKIIMFASAEMSMKHILERRVARELGISILQLRNTKLTDTQEDILIRLAGENSERHVYYMRNGCSSNDVMNEAMKLKENVGLDIIFIDYLQFLSDCWSSGYENQNVRVGKASKTLKTIANELNIPVVVASQLNRALEHRGEADRKPNLADLRDSGNIEQDADVVLLLDRVITNTGGAIDNSILEVKMAKNRQIGSMPAVTIRFNLVTRRYESIKNPPRRINTQEESLI